MSELAFPELDEAPAVKPAPALLPALVTIKDATLAQFTRTEADLRAIAAKYNDVAFDVTTTKGMTAAKQARQEIRDARFTVQRLEKNTKAELNDLKSTVQDTAAALVSIIEPAEANVHNQIRAHEERVAAEKAERERLEAERVAKHRANIDRIRSYAVQAQGQPSEKIIGAYNFVANLTFGPEYEEFCDEAANARDEVLLALNALYATTLNRELEAARLEAQRAEQARIAAEQAEAQRKLDEQAAELKRRQDEIDRAEREAQAKRDSEAEAARIAALPPEANHSPDVKKMVEDKGEQWPAPTEALPIAAANSLNITIAEAIPRTPAEEFAALLDGREYGNEITDTEASYAKAAGLVVLFGYSDDNMEFRGAIDDEIGCYEGGTAYLTDKGLMRSQCNEGDDCPYFMLAIKTAATIEARWDVDGYSWIYETAIPHATFEIVEGDEKFCRSIVFALADVSGRGAA